MNAQSRGKTISEPTLVENQRPETRTSPPQGTPSGGSERRGGLKTQLGAGTYEEGQKLLQAETSVQRKPDPKGAGKKRTPKAEGGEDGEVDELRKENAGLKDRVTNLEGANSKQQQQLDQTNAELDQIKSGLLQKAERDIGEKLDEILAHLGDADAALSGLETLVESTLVIDDQRGESDEGIKKSIKDHNEAQKPGLVEGLSLMLDFANLLKTGLTLRTILRKSDSTKLDKFAAVVDATTAGNEMGNGTAEFVGGMDDAAEGDSTVGMIVAIDKKVGAVEKGVESLREHQFGKEKYAVGAALSKAVSTRDGVQESLEALGDKATKDLQAKADGVNNMSREAARDFSERLPKLDALLKARDPKLGGGGELAIGSTGRSAFDLVSAHPAGCTLFAETTLHVQASRYDKYTTSEERSAFWLRVNDAGLRAELKHCLFLWQAYPVRPSFVQRDDLNVPTEIGRPLSTLIGQEVMPFERVQMKGPVIEEWVTRERWEDPEQRECLFVRPAPAPTDPLRRLKR